MLRDSKLLAAALLVSGCVDELETGFEPPGEEGAGAGTALAANGSSTTCWARRGCTSPRRTDGLPPSSRTRSSPRGSTRRPDRRRDGRRGRWPNQARHGTPTRCTSPWSTASRKEAASSRRRARRSMRGEGRGPQHGLSGAPSPRTRGTLSVSSRESWPTGARRVPAIPFTAAPRFPTPILSPEGVTSLPSGRTRATAASWCSSRSRLTSTCRGAC